MANNKKIVLCVEDESAMLRALNDKFTKEGFKVISTTNGEDGYESAIKEKPDIIIMDIIMPKLDGMSLMKKIREDEGWGSDVPIIMLTNVNDPENVSEAAHFRVFDFLVKTDWHLDDVVDLVKKKLNIS